LFLQLCETMKKHKEDCKLKGLVIIILAAVLSGIAIWYFYQRQLVEIDRAIEQIDNVQS